MKIYRINVQEVGDFSCHSSEVKKEPFGSFFFLNICNDQYYRMNDVSWTLSKK